MQMNRVGANGIGSADVPPPQLQQMEDVMGQNDPMLPVLLNNNHEMMYALYYFSLHGNLCTT
jgi:hypothetical protein